MNRRAIALMTFVMYLLAADAMGAPLDRPAGDPVERLQPERPFDIARPLRAVLDRGLGGSSTLRSMVTRLSAMPEVELTVRLRLPRPGSRAFSEFRIRRRGLQLQNVSAQLAIPPGIGQVEQISMFGHELAHVLQLVEGQHDPRSDEGEDAAVALECVIRQELRAGSRSMKTEGR